MTPTARRFGRVTHVALIGGGDLMLRTARLARDAGLAATVVLAPRHAVEPLPLAGVKTHDAFAAGGFAIHVVDDINTWPDLGAADWTGAYALALGFGPSWIFGKAVLARFGAGMINFNGIPVPRYLGGAHYTWQILNGDRTSGCILQEITTEIDRGPILRRELFELPATVRVPDDYFRANFEVGCRFMEDAIADIRGDKPFPAIDFATFDEDRLYFPRLHTLENGWIDWSWAAADIERFCCAFDRPYAGASTFVDGSLVRLKDVRLADASEALHPFVAGLVVRRAAGEAWVAAMGGLLAVGAASLEDGRDASGLLKEGHRLHTPPDRLSRALTFRPALTSRGFDSRRR